MKSNINDNDNAVSSQQQQQQQKNSSSEKSPRTRTYSFSVPLINARPKPESFVETFIELWNDPRPVTSLVQSDDRSFVGERRNDKGLKEEIPYCIISDEFEIEDESFQILLYPRGRFVRDYSSSSSDKESDSGGSISGPAGLYLRYLPQNYGDEIDIAWKLKLCDKNPSSSSSSSSTANTYLSVSTSGGLPRSKDTWSSAMTFCTEFEAVESVGRATDWGSSSWYANEICNALDNLVAEGEVTVFDTRKGESSFACWPPFSKGGIGAVIRAVTSQYSYNGKNKNKNNNDDTKQQQQQREFRVGEVIVARNIQEFTENNQKLKESFIYPGVDYRIMTMSDKEGNSIFTTESLSNDEEKSQARLALRPCGWKLQNQLWNKKQKNQTQPQDLWPVEVEAGLLANVTSTRFNPESAIPRLVAAFQRDFVAYTFALFVALAPIPFALTARNFISFYAIPSASMEPTLMKGDVLLVEKLPGVYQRTNRGDVILFQPPPTLRDIVTQSGSQLSSTSLFVKRIVGLPGDTNIKLSVGDNSHNNDVFINGELAVGPDRDMCSDEPLRLIDRLLENGKGKEIEKLGENEVYVLGDCKAVSVDSRVFGTLPKENVVGRPLARIWPLNRFGSGKF